MLRLQSISLTHFKNYSSRSFHIAERIVGICGNNGAGKTSLLDAIHYLCFTKSYFTRDTNNVQEGKAGFRIEGNFLLHDKKEKAVCILRETPSDLVIPVRTGTGGRAGGKKEFAVNELVYEKFSQHIGHYPCVIIAPDDSQLITGDSKERRTFLDALLCQLDSDYLENLIVYTKVLQQRNSLLRS
ncbi:MAG: AAA family ATPase, partial [Bacteroidia bacterium]|nr:AAA family ATPase [Bacteroidia bacterium]